MADKKNWKGTPHPALFAAAKADRERILAELAAEEAAEAAANENKDDQEPKEAVVGFGDVQLIDDAQGDDAAAADDAPADDAPADDAPADDAAAEEAPADDAQANPDE